MFIIVKCVFIFKSQIHPLTGPMEGGTLVTIRGSNLGTSEKEIQNKITIGGVACKIIDYNVSVK